MDSSEPMGRQEGGWRGRRNGEVSGSVLGAGLEDREFVADGLLLSATASLNLLEQCCPLELSVLMEMSYLINGHWLQLASEPLKSS